MTGSKYQLTVGLEIHAELKTAAKMFCDCANDPEEKTPNKNVCPVCLAHPGTLPTINKKAVGSMIKIGLALGGNINPVTKFDRKNYFYPDMPKGYQISQYDEPIVRGGNLKSIRINRVHLEEDVGRLQHAKDGALVDYNRAGIPLMELVTEPDVRLADQAVEFARELQTILRYLGVSDADMEKGEMRIEANVSLDMGTKVEVKNINSFRAVHDAIEYEAKRQKAVLEKGEKVIQETRGWDDVKRTTFSQRIKEEAHDYRYFPEPDLPPFETSVFRIEDLKESLPELPDAKRKRFAEEYNIKNAELLIGDKALADFFESAASELDAMDLKDKTKSRELLLNYLTTDLKGIMADTGSSFGELKMTPEHVAHLIGLIDQKKIGSRQAKDILKLMFETGEDPETIMTSRNLETVDDAAHLAEVVRRIISENGKAAADYKNGKVASLQFLIGKAMGELKGRGNPETLREIFIRNIK